MITASLLLISVGEMLRKVVILRIWNQRSRLRSQLQAHTTKFLSCRFSLEEVDLLWAEINEAARIRTQTKRAGGKDTMTVCFTRLATLAQVSDTWFVNLAADLNPRSVTWMPTQVATKANQYNQAVTITKDAESHSRSVRDGMISLVD